MTDAAIPVDQEDLLVLLNCLPESRLTRSERDVAHRIRKAGNDALHKSDSSSREEPMAILSMTAELVKRLLQRR